MKHLIQFDLIDGKDIYLYDDMYNNELYSGPDAVSTVLSSKIVAHALQLKNVMPIDIGKYKTGVCIIKLKFTKFELNGLINGVVDDKFLPINCAFNKKTKIKEILENLLTLSGTYVLHKINEDPTYYSELFLKHGLRGNFERFNFVISNSLFLPKFLVKKFVLDTFVVKVNLEKPATEINETIGNMRFIMHTSNFIGVKCNGNNIYPSASFGSEVGFTRWEICDEIYVEANNDRSVARIISKSNDMISCVSVSQDVVNLDAQTLQNIACAEILTPIYKPSFHKKSVGETKAYTMFTRNNLLHDIVIVKLKV